MKAGFIPLKETTELPESSCPSCKQTIAAASSIDHVALPKPGDVTVCLYCGAILELEEGFKLRLITREKRRLLARKQPETWAQLKELSETFRNAVAATTVSLREKSKPH